MTALRLQGQSETRDLKEAEHGGAPVMAQEASFGVLPTLRLPGNFRSTWRNLLMLAGQIREKVDVRAQVDLGLIMISKHESKVSGESW